MANGNCIECWDKIANAKPGKTVVLCSEDCRKKIPADEQPESPETQELIY